MAQRSSVPLWVPHPMLPGWVVTGIGFCGDDRAGARATVLCCSGPAPLGGPGDAVLVAEEPGVGIGARFAGLDGSDPEWFADRAPDGKVQAAGHPTAMWFVPTADDRCALLGEASGMWLWAVLWPATADVMLLEDIGLADARTFGPAAYELLGYGALAPHMTTMPATEA